MKSILISPNQANGTSALTESTPLVTLPFLGESFISYWFEHLSTRGVTGARVVTMEEADRLDALPALGARWGLQVEICQEERDLTPEEAREKYLENGAPSPKELELIELDHLPGLPEHKLFESYGTFFRGISFWLAHVTQSHRIGLREIEPGVWAGRRVRVSPTARFHAPCWLGDNVQVGRDAVIGPFAFLEDRVVVEESCEVLQSWVGPDTFLGSLTRVESSLAWGSLLIDWETNSHTLVPDTFLMCSLAEKRHSHRTRPKSRAREAEPSLARPIEAVISIAQKIQG